MRPTWIPQALIACYCCAALTSQAPLGAPATIRPEIATATPTQGSPASKRMLLGDDALAAGDPQRATTHYLAALELHPASPAILRKLIEAHADDAEAKALYAHLLALALCDDRGKVTYERSDRALLPKDDFGKALATAQANAVRELARYAGRLGNKSAGSGVLARHAADLALELGREMPQVLAACSEELTDAMEATRPDVERVLQGLAKMLDARPSGTAPPAQQGGSDEATDAAAQAQRRLELAAIDRGMRAARILTGLGAQQGFGDELEGPAPPELGDYPRRGGEALGELRRRAEQLAEGPWTIEQLEELTPTDRILFTEEHESWARPGIALSPQGLYTIYTTCGFETLLGAAQTIEFHHRRLANWFGADPFEGRPGIIRIEPEHEGLEANGSPFWWAGGFQSGDVTVVRFAWGSIEGLGRTLTHELTHRFDGAIHPFQPAWMVEGRAVWTGRCYGRIEDDGFVEDFLSPYAIQGPFVKSYGGLDKLTTLLDGTIEDYRDNYPVGYALFTYLKTWQDDEGRPLFAERLRNFLKNGRAGSKDPVGFFTATFADGKDGRPDGLEAFREGWHQFLLQCYRWSWGGSDRDEQNAWIPQRYTLELVRSNRWARRVMDAPTFSWARNRAEPWFGQGHAMAAARLLSDVSDYKAAAVAACWSLQVDGYNDENAELAIRALQESGERDAAWVVRQMASARIATIAPPEGDAPHANRFGKVRALQKALREKSEMRKSTSPTVAAALASRHDRLAYALGGVPLAIKLAKDRSSRFPVEENPHALGIFGWAESGLTSYEERRAEGLWYEADSGDLHVGRRKPKDTTGTMDRTAHQRHAFVHSNEWLAPGEYVVRSRVHFTTSFISGALVFGYTRRDRNLRLQFSAGDFLYAIGRKEDNGTTKQVELELGALWERDGPLPGGNPRHIHEFKEPSSYVDLTVHVSGPTARCYADDEYVFSYTTPDLSPIEGAVGLAMGQGAVRWQTPTVQRMDVNRLQTAPAADRTINSLLYQRLVELPRAPAGALLIWLPVREEPKTILRDTARLMRRVSVALTDRITYPQPCYLVVPPALPDDIRKEMETMLQEFVPGGLPLLPDRIEGRSEKEAWAAFVDGRGVVRAVERVEQALPGTVSVWARHYRPPVRPHDRETR